METAPAKKTVKKDQRKLILEGFKIYVLDHGSEPASIFKFAQSLKLKEADFYTYFTSFKSIKSSIWTSIFEDTLAEIQKQEVFASYSAREKFLGFLFTWIEELKKSRSYLLVLYGDKVKALRELPADTREFKRAFIDFSEEILAEGKETEEIADRPYVTEKYGEALWLQVMFVLRFWVDDRSPRFEKTDAAVEKSVNLAFDLMGKSALDTFLDFAKFLYQNK
ncbi:TetR/AcrR family transcriptional regulator [Algoriphagus aestuariicola]|uniref:TetR/AcrR family transcriptional regulator n=1 Tax=Algoriphagus aestuariicola TaxID=1852016 RepID=A0ABS3BR28_9BACT|nr:TetR family transcriptional regulator C-terminal domain-containing protein [Algoriphagus aestuariicola]MBN7801346.1 TetR/AcrR family transcriptional regulator [Algoriphagus aestuariicola]